MIAIPKAEMRVLKYHFSELIAHYLLRLGRSKHVYFLLTTYNMRFQLYI